MMLRCNVDESRHGENGETRGNSRFPRAGKRVLTTGKMTVKNALRFYRFPVSTIPHIFHRLCAAISALAVIS